MSAPDDKDWTEGHRHGPLISSAIKDPFDPEAGGFRIGGEAPIIPPTLVPTAPQGPLRLMGGWVDYGGSFRLKEADNEKG